jgi:hypothetical protein
MSWFPQIGRGSITQFPVRRSRKWRSISNQMENSETIQLPDTTAGQIEWQLSLQELSDAEVATLNSFFVAAHGQFSPFLLIDPLANLLGWSEDSSRPDWQFGLMTQSAGVADPVGTTRASTLNNSSPGAQTLQQTLAEPGDYVACFSAWISSNVAGTVSLQRDGVSVTCQIGPTWRRFYVGGKGVGGASQSTFSLSLAAGQSVRIWGLQVEAQPSPSAYKQTKTAAGIHEETYFGGDELTITSTGVGLSSCDTVLTSRI